MAKQKKAKKSTVEQDLKAKLKKVRAQLSVAEKSAGKWKQRAQKQQKVAASLKSELTAARRRATKAESVAEKWKRRAASADTTPSEAAAPASAPSVPDGSPQAQAGAPDESWTVTALRAEARRRGIAGYSRKTKSQLLVDLRG